MTTWVSVNLESEHVRSVGIPLLVCLANISGIASSQIYPSSDGPRYIKGNATSLGLEVVALAGLGVIYVLLRSRNKKRAQAIAKGEKEEDTAFKYVF